MAPEPFTAAQRAALLTVLSRFSGIIERVDLYGSRARGLFRPGSDADLVLVGSLDAQGKAAIEQDLEESDLSLFVDVSLESELSGTDLGREIQKDRQILFSRAELEAAASVTSAS